MVLCNESLIRKGVEFMSVKVKELQLVELPRMIVASIAFSGENCEDECARVMIPFIKQYQLDKEPDFHYLGFGYNDENGKYVYELWTSVPHYFTVPAPFTRKVFAGGLYALLPATLANITRNWEKLHDLVVMSPNLEHDTDNGRDIYLEEVNDIEKFHKPDAKLKEREINLLLPVRLVKNKVIETVNVEYREVKLPTVTIAGSYYDLKAGSKPWKKSVPWYKLAKTLFQIGQVINECMNNGSNTYTLVYGSSENNKAFYLDAKKGKATKIFAAVELLKSFPFYPNGLIEQKLEERNYVMFYSSIDPSKARTIKLSFKNLYDEAMKYFAEKEEIVDDSYCLEREYRNDGRYVDRIELYIPLKDTTICD
jgi:hypothetical protein